MLRFWLGLVGCCEVVGGGWFRLGVCPTSEKTIRCCEIVGGGLVSTPLNQRGILRIRIRGLSGVFLVWIL